MNISDDQLIKDINKLPKSEKEVMIMHYNKQLGFDKISELLNITETEVTEIHKRAFDKICEGVIKAFPFR